MEFNSEFGDELLAAAQERGPPVSIVTSCGPPVGTEGVKDRGEVAEGRGAAAEING
jgi:hypothetical protein